MEESLVKNGYCTKKESITFEAKECRDKLPKDIWQTYSSFANTLGGTIALGFKEEGPYLKLSGIVDPQKIMKDLWDLLNDPRKVSANILTDSDVRIEEDNDIQYIVITVPRAERHIKPIYVNGSLDNGTYRRNNESDYHCSVPEILEMGRDSSDSSTDQRVVEKSSFKDVNITTLERFRNHLRSYHPSHPWLTESDEEFLRLIGAADLDDDRFRLTYAGLLMFGNDYRISREIPDYHLDYKRYLNDMEWSDRVDSGSGLWSGNIFDFFLDISNKIASASEHPFILDGFRRIDDNDVIKAMREIVLNGLVHADYLGKGGVNVSLWNDKLVVSNPGNFRIPVSKALRGGYSDARNPLMMKMFTLLGFVERAGSGIYRVIRTCREEGLEEPLMEESFNPSRVTVTLKLKKSGDLSFKIINMMNKDEKISVDSLAEKIGVSKSTVAREITKLKAEGTIRRVGGTRGHWEIADDRL
ncbi:transcriptional regulator [methanogenic archaeon mixed culture ISO4-G1]|nr:transcriptional regulator [methanogenic archaeon mixed culture ISO4-G1]